ncbi:MAG: N-acetylornithine carbamoyltransferase [Anaerolineae bacterium]
MFGIEGRNFINTADFTQEEIQALIDLALKIKQGKAAPSLAGKVLATVFFNPSVRTRTSFAAGMFKLGGLAIDLTPGKGSWTFEFEENVVMDGVTAEHVKEAAPVLSGYSDALAVRSSELVTTAAESVEVTSWETLKQDTVVGGFARHATVPVINMESNVYHPCQGLGDAVTLKETLGETQGKKFVLTWAYHPKALPMATPNSQMLAACDLGLDVVVARPEGWALDPKIMATAIERARACGGSVTTTTDQTAAFEGADVICAKSWGALEYYGDWEEEKRIREGLKGWMVDADKMALTRDAYFMHCLPIRRNVVASDAVLDSPNSIVVQQAENRMWAQMALLAALLT